MAIDTNPPTNPSAATPVPLPGLIVDAVYEDGVLRPAAPLDLPEGAQVQILVAARIAVAPANGAGAGPAAEGDTIVHAPAVAPANNAGAVPGPAAEGDTIVQRPAAPAPGVPAGWRAALAAPLAASGLLAGLTRLDGLLVLGVLLVYALTRFIGLGQFPIYFFCDEAIQATLAEDLIRRGFRDASGTFLPPYFLNAEKWNLSLSVYIHTLGVGLLGKSVEVTRGTSVLVTLLAALALMLTLKLVFTNRFWWAGGLVLAAIPAWFLHSRTAFETAMMVSFYAAFLCCYLLYRYRDPRWLFPALVFGGMTFYSYANGQGVMLVSGVLLLLSDLRYHLRQPPRLLAIAVLLLLLLLVPFIRFRYLNPDAIDDQLRDLHSYWFSRLSLGEKFARFGQNYLLGLSPAYWFLPNDVDLARHQMKGMGHMPLFLLPFVLAGAGVCLWRWRSSAHRAVLIAALAAPFSAAIVGVAVTRVMAMVAPVTLLACIGLDLAYGWLRRRVAYGLAAAAIGLLLVAASFLTLRAALVDGPTWYADYGLGGMQYGAAQLFAEAIPQEIAKSPDTRILVSPTWANNPNVFLTYFLNESQRRRIEMINIDAFLVTKGDLSLNQLFVMPDYEYERARTSGKFLLAPPERVLPYPDGRPGFYFVRMQYVENVDELFAADRAARQQLHEGMATIDGQQVRLAHSLLDMGAPPDLFDGDFYTLVRGMEANPLVLELGFPGPRPVTGITLTVGTMDFAVDVELTPAAGGEPLRYTQTFTDGPPDPTVELAFPGAPAEVSRVRIAIKSLDHGETAHIHVRELALWR